MPSRSAANSVLMVLLLFLVGVRAIHSSVSFLLRLDSSFSCCRQRNACKLIPMVPGTLGLHSDTTWWAVWWALLAWRAVHSILLVFSMLMISCV